MKIFMLIIVVIVFSVPARSQGLQDGGHGSGGDEKGVYSLSVNAKWNLVSVPFSVPNYAALSVFPTAASSAFGFENGYVLKGTLVNGAGYWMRFASSQTVPLNGTLRYSDSVTVADGWNLVGSISDPIPAASVVGVGTTVLSLFYSYNNGYHAASTIEPGMGYWVKTSSPGKLMMSSGSSAAPKGTDAASHRMLTALNQLILTDASGGEQILFFGAADSGKADLFELPPAPPAGAMDARYASQRLVAFDDQGILITSATYPLRVRWQITVPGDFMLITGSKETPMKSSGTMVLKEATSHLALHVGESANLPKEFALAQSYPNPFNPSATIRFDLPTSALVSLKVYDPLGRVVSTLIESDPFDAGFHQVEFNAGNLATGVYFYRISAQSQGRNFTDVKKMLLMK